MNLFIDTNVYLTFYHFSNDDLEELKKLRVAIEEAKIQLLLPEQVKVEFNRNRESKIADALTKFSEQSVPNKFPQILKDYPKFKLLKKKTSDLQLLRDELVNQLKSDVFENKLGADLLIKELFEVAILIPTSSVILKKAKNRYETGNPPGKSGSLGDAINWESLLSHVDKDFLDEEVKKDIYIIARDKDYLSAIDRSRFSQFLKDEWKNDKGTELHYYSSLSDFFSKHFPDIKLASELERNLAVSKFISSWSFASTHLAIAKLAKYSEFTPKEINLLIDGFLTNPQIYSIAEDKDVKSFILNLIKVYPNFIEENKVNQITSMYAKTTQDQIPNDDNYEDIPF